MLFDMNNLHAAITSLLTPVIAILIASVAFAVLESGIAIGERLFGLRQMRQSASDAVIKTARHRLERADLLARIPPMLGLMATIIPLGPGLAALGQGNPAQLAQAVTTAFDATVLGLIAGIAGLVIGKLRRRWYEDVLESLES
ncbi:MULTISPECIES: MotA/TolQ/ExbB proton channel family protein [Methylovorus]|jgi:biopolymer transport protein ExbB/TolQ|uniref:MotA/TolQ/ExbB proton channel n=1 Tax=Methylovorus glucosotrophus (strain SIP3-4) TaxID=582744 RepID=C6X8C8_METGS|nr:MULTISPECIES: MotA/TolQ/ExbB proton channel family protein [Methylovorus]ACT49398.1 MotA/TolQ/ExbB proton channel [Methylovorus glucosotrophus SIP3-4]KAF0836015.1 outer membrane transport energization protein ExbB [Methylovorus glucosotrophus]MCB4810680.1 MotA/TolQ/ExbB proton channel family protein [Methylovorus menthalis]MCB5207134.1 MotA/TolQ/ExbB proton channel family protein [Methylovorus mays]